MPDWLIGALLPIAGVAIVGLLSALVKRAALYERCWKLGTWLRGLGLGYDLPVITGETETKFKDTIFSTISDALRGLARGIAGKPLEEKPEPTPPEG